MRETHGCRLFRMLDRSAYISPLRGSKSLARITKGVLLSGSSTAVSSLGKQHLLELAV
jgi:hypothetical protein